MKKYILGCIGIFLCSNFFSQGVVNIVTIRNASTLQAISGAQAEINSTAYKSNESGEIVLTDVQGTSSIVINHPWYQTVTTTLDQLKSTNNVVYMTEKVSSFDEVVVSASKFEEKAKDVAQPIHVIRSTDLENFNQSSTADVISSTGKVMVQKSQLGGGSPVIRGFETNKVLMVVDGVRMNNAIYRGGHLQNIITLDNAMMDKVEIVFGPGSVVYGSDALGGVMHFYTKNPILSTTDKPLVKAGAYTRYMSAANGYAANANISVGGKKIASFTSFTYSNFDDLKQGSNRNSKYSSFGIRNFYVDRINGVDSMVVNKDSNVQVGSGYKQYDLTQKFLFKSSENLTHILNFQFSTSTDIPRYDRLVQLSGSKPKFGDWYYGPQKRLFASYSILFSDKNKFYDQGRLIFAYQNIEESRNDRRFGKNLLNHRIEKVDVMSMNADFEKKFKKQELRYGMEFYYNDVNSSAYVEDIVADTTAKLDTRYADGGASMKSAAIYVTHTWELNEKWILNDGLRVSYVGLDAKFVDPTFFPFPFSSVAQKSKALNGNIALIYMPTKFWKINGIFSTGFRAPNVDDLSKVFESTPGKLVVPNPDIKPEYTYNAELGITKMFGQRVTLSATVYYTWYKNAIATWPSTFNGNDSVLYEGQMSQVVSTQNKAEAFLYGVESNLNAVLTKSLSLNSTLNYTYARIKTDTTDYPLDHIPPVFGKTSLNFSMKKFRAEFFVQYSGWKKIKDYNLVSGEDNDVYATVDGMPAWYTLNLRTTYQFNKAFSLQVACENILDQNYRQFSSNISAPGRNFILTLRGNF